MVSLLGFVAGLVSKVVILTGPLGDPSADEALVGLMAMHFLDGEWSTFYWGQAYGGSLDVILLMPVVALLGATRAALAVIPFLQSLTVLGLVWAIGRRLLGDAGAVVSASLVWVFPASFVWWQTRQSVIYLPVIILGLTALLFALRVDQHPERKLDWLVMGVVTGLGFWTSPHILYFALPVTVWLLVRLGTRAIRLGWPSVLGFVVGAWPWLAANIGRGWPSLQTLPIEDSPIDRLDAFFRLGFPMTLGSRVPFTEGWVLGPMGPVIAAVGTASILIAVMRRRFFLRPHIWILLSFPAIFALIPAPAYVGSGRYFVFLAPIVAVTLASLFQGRSARIALILIAICLTGIAIFQTQDRSFTNAPPTEPLVEALDREGVDHVVAGYWVAYKLAWETGERILASPVIVNRYEPYLEAIRGADIIGYVYVAGNPSEEANAEAMRSFLASSSVGYEEAMPAGYVLIIPNEVVDPGQLPLEAIQVP